LNVSGNVLTTAIHMSSIHIIVVLYPIRKNAILSVDINVTISEFNNIKIS